MNKVAGQIAYNELKYRVGGPTIEVNKGRGPALLARSSTIAMENKSKPIRVASMEMDPKKSLAERAQRKKPEPKKPAPDPIKE